MTGQIDVLNVGSGHLELHYNLNDPVELERAKRAVEDMIKRGFILFVHGQDEKLMRVESFDAQKNVYVIGDVPGAEALTEVSTPMKKKGRPVREVPAASAKVTAIGRSAGG
jgi:hypothetical protein